MDTKKDLNQQLASEIKKKISDTSAYVCNGNTIVKVCDISINLDKNYASNMVETITFTGTAEFEISVNNGLFSQHCSFSSWATVHDFKIADVATPITIHISNSFTYN